MVTITANTEFSSSHLTEIFYSDAMNKKCFDCENNTPSWASINNGIYICSTCVELHKDLGDNISRLKSLFVDKFSTEEIKCLKCGGNHRLTELLSIYKLNKNSLNRVLFYNSKILDYHRSSIQSEVYNTKCPIMPKEENAFELSEDCNKDEIQKLLSKGKGCFLYRGFNAIYSLINNKTNYAYTSIKTSGAIGTLSEKGFDIFNKLKKVASYFIPTFVFGYYTNSKEDNA